jgi:hypothetical protein
MTSTRLEAELRGLRAKIAGHLLRHKAEKRAGADDLARFHSTTALGLSLRLVDVINELEAIK